MSAGEYCNREVVVVEKYESINEVIKLMRSQHVGDVVVVEQREGVRVPIGIFTDRDIVLELLAEDIDFDAVSVGDVMSFELVTVHDEASLLDAIKLMRSKGIRRMPVTNDQGALLGILTVDDLLALIAEQSTSRELAVNSKPRNSRSLAPAAAKNSVRAY